MLQWSLWWTTLPKYQSIAAVSHDDVTSDTCWKWYSHVLGDVTRASFLFLISPSPTPPGCQEWPGNHPSPVPPQCILMPALIGKVLTGSDRIPGWTMCQPFLLPGALVAQGFGNPGQACCNFALRPATGTEGNSVVWSEGKDVNVPDKRGGKHTWDGLTRLSASIQLTELGATYGTEQMAPLECICYIPVHSGPAI